METKYVLLIDDNKNFMESAVKFLSTDKHFSVVEWAPSAEEAFDKINKFNPDLVLMDISLPGMNGFEATKIIKQGKNPPVVIILSINNCEVYSEEAKLSGADGYLSKSDFGNKMIPLIKSIFQKAEKGVN